MIQLLGDIDNLVSEDDNKDLQAIARRPFAWVTVRGTGHGNIVDFEDKTRAGNLVLGEYRRRKFELVTTKSFDEIEFQNEVQPFQPDTDVTHLVFVVHGIRDLGEWAAAFEQELRAQFRADRQASSPDKLAVESIRYGYFGMGPFLLRPIREKYVKWFMDEYTEALARYPEAREVHFVGHSNGTYLMAAALKRYDSLDVKRVVFGGSVVRRDYDWSLQARPAAPRSKCGTTRRSTIGSLPCSPGSSSRACMVSSLATTSAAPASTDSGRRQAKRCRPRSRMSKA